MVNVFHAIAVSLSVIGFTFVGFVTVGLVLNGKQCAIALDQFAGTCFISGHMADETVSAWAHRKHHKRTERLINFMFNDPNHCAAAYVSEMESMQEPIEYRKG